MWILAIYVRFDQMTVILKQQPVRENLGMKIHKYEKVFRKNIETNKHIGRKSLKE